MATLKQTLVRSLDLVTTSASAAVAVIEAANLYAEDFRTQTAFDLKLNRAIKEKESLFDAAERMASITEKLQAKTSLQATYASLEAFMAKP